MKYIELTAYMSHNLDALTPPILTSGIYKRSSVTNLEYNAMTPKEIRST